MIRLIAFVFCLGMLILGCYFLVSKMTYEEQLQTDDWKEKRLEILSRDWFMCQKCMNTHHLNVHHKYYINDGRKAWEYPNSALITLCNGCHKQVHFTEEIGPPKPMDDLAYALERLVIVCTRPKLY